MLYFLLPHGQQAHEKTLLANIKDMQIETATSGHLTPTGMTTVVVCWGCRNPVPQPGWLRQQKHIFSQFWRLEVPTCGRVQFLQSPLPLACRWQPFPCVLTWPFLCAHTSRVSLDNLISSCVDTRQIGLGLTLMASF